MLGNTAQQAQQSVRYALQGTTATSRLAIRLSVRRGRRPQKDLTSVMELSD